jgi:hypothetical protein
MKINTENTAKIQAALDAINGRADTHTFTSGAVLRLARNLSAKLQAVLGKAGSRGATLHAVSSGPVPSSYNGKRICNSLVLEVCPSGVFLTQLYRLELWPNEGGTRRITLTDDQEKKVVRNFCHN